jgi:bacterioferritin-associated ferredoxin
MYICVCNALTDKQVESAITSGCRRPNDIYSQCGTKPQCGRCAERMLELLEATDIQPAAPAQA